MSEAPRKDDWTAAIEAGCAFVAIMAYIWVLRGVYSPFWVFILVAIVISHRLRREGPRQLGFRISGLREGLKAVAPALVGLVVILAVIGLLFNTVRTVGLRRDVSNLSLYLLWGLFQQYLLNGYFVNRFLLAFPGNRGKRASLLLAALLFGAAHAPNLFLMGVAFAGGYVCTRIYVKYRNLYLLGFLHGVVGFALNLVLPDGITHYFLVGPGYFRK